MRDDIRIAIKGMSQKERREYLVDHGLCAICGGEAAPYYLCADHRTVASVRKMTNRMAKLGIFKKMKMGRSNHYWMHENWTDDRSLNEFRWGTHLLDMDADDERRRPRLGRKPVDLDETLIQIFRDADRPLSEEEIVCAWGKLRSRRKTETLAGDMTALILAERRRQERAAKRAKSMGNSQQETAAEAAS